MTGFEAWIGRETVQHDRAFARSYAQLAALLDHAQAPWPSGSVPPLGHWLHFLPNARQSDVGEDGHPKRGVFLPDDLPPRRMWASSRIKFEAPIALEASLERRTVVSAITPKQGRSGAMVFVTLAHEIRADGVLAILEEQDIVYRALPPTDAPLGAPPARTGEAVGVGHWSRSFLPDATLLFRYSALTYNAHRIHYDLPYARDVEGYPALVVQGPLIATLLMDHLVRRSPSARVTGFSFRAVSPLFVGSPARLCGETREGGAELWASGPNGGLAMQASVEFAAQGP